MVRILQVFGRLDRGGAETMIINYYRSIDRGQIQFDFVTHFDEEGAYEAEILRLGGRIFRLPRFVGYNIVAYQRAWQRLLREHTEWRTIHIHIFTIAGVILPVAKRCGVTRRIVHCHIAHQKFSALYYFVNGVLKTLANKYATHRLACGDEAGRYYFGKRDFTVMNNAIDARKFVFNSDTREAKRKELNIEDKFVIGHIGRFNEQKNHPFIVDIFREVHAQNSNARLLLIGDGEPIMSQMKQRVAEAGLSDSVIFTGSRPDVAELMQAMDVFLFPSLWEGLGIVAIEAQAAGLHTLVSDGVPDEAMITELAHKISLQQSAEYWAQEVLKYNNNYPRQDMFAQIRNAGYEVTENIAWLERFYTTV